MDFLQLLKDTLGFHGTIAGFQIVATILVFSGILASKVTELSRRQAFWLGVAWISVFSVEYWIAGPYSFVQFGVEIQLSLPLHLMLNEWNDGGQFFHAFAGGNDMAASSALTGQVVSLERMLLATFPLWVANAINKIFAVFVTFVGMYLFARRVVATERLMAVGLAALASVANDTMAGLTWTHGIGNAIIPLAAYLCVGRYGKRHYWTGVIAVAIIYAISCTPTHSAMALFPALFLAAFFIGFRRSIQVLPAIFLVFVFLIANWHDSLIAKAMVGPYTARGIEYTRQIVTVDDFMKNAWGVLTMSREATSLAILGLFISWKRRWRFGSMMTIAVVGFYAGTVLRMLPWEGMGLRVLGGVNFHSMSYGMGFLGLSILGAACGRSRAHRVDVASPRTGRFSGRAAFFLAALVVAMAVGKLTWYKAITISSWLNEGGIIVLSNGLKEMEKLELGPPENSRVVTVPYRISPNMASVVGLHSLDGTYNLLHNSLAQYWKNGVLKGDGIVDGGFLTMNTKDFDPKCCASYNINQIMNLDFLRIANVGFILSVLPLVGDGINLVAGPRDKSVPPRNTEPLGQRLAGYFRMIFDPAPIRAYALLSPLPRVFAAKARKVMADATTDEAFSRVVAGKALGQTVVVREGELPVGAGVRSGLRILEYSLVRDGFDVTVAAPDGGIAVFNTPYYPFWEAEADGRRIPVFPVNAIHTAVVVPKGGRKIKLRYRRPALSDLIIPLKSNT